MTTRIGKMHYLPNNNNNSNCTDQATRIGKISHYLSDMNVIYNSTSNLPHQMDVPSPQPVTSALWITLSLSSCSDGIHNVPPKFPFLSQFINFG